MTDSEINKKLGDEVIKLITEVRRNAFDYARERKNQEFKALVKDKIMELQDMEERQSNSLKLQGYREARRKLEELQDEIE